MKRLIKLNCIIVVLILISNIIVPNFYVEGNADDNSKEFFKISDSYSKYYDKYSAYPKPDYKIILNGNEYNKISDDKFTTGNYEGKENVLIWDSLSGEVSYETDIPASGIYSVCISYCALPSSLQNTEISFKIDGTLPYDTASRIILNKTWENSAEPSYDIYGNQNHPSQTQKIMWNETYFMDSDGLFSDPLIFYFEKGTHTITLSSEKAYIAIESLNIKNVETVENYKEYIESIETTADISQTPSALIRIEGEDYFYTSDSILCPTYDKNDCMCSPSDPIKTVFNTFGNELWNKSLQSAAWKINIANDGWYKIGIKYKQDEIRGISTNRRIYIDGKVPFDELNSVAFAYTTDWDLLIPSDYIYLKNGTHTITMEAIPAQTGEAIRSLDSVISNLNTYYRKIIMITGTNPDKYTDYYVHQKIPDIIDEFSKLSEELKQIQNNIENLSGFKGSEASQLERMYIILDKCIEKPLKIPEYVSQIKDNISALSSWSRTFREQPLEIDYIEFASPDMEFSKINSGFFQSVIFMIKSFFGSFFNNYSILSNSEQEDTLEVWVCLGRDQTQIIKELTDSKFTEKYGINVNINLVQGTILESCIAGNSPDTALFLGGEFPINLAIRDLTVCLSDFDDYDEISKRFHDNADIQYMYNDKVYGLPISQSWSMMFYRKDILNELGFDAPPETWQDLIDMLPALQRNYMSAGLVLPASDIAVATESGHTYASLLMQNNISYYNKDMTASNFNDTNALQLFEFWTDLYTKYGFEQSYDAFSRFRTGEYPIVIQDYSFANQLSVAAPEINGLWDFTSICGSETESGISHAINSNGSGGVIFKNSDNIDNAWTFLKWFTSDEIQIEYANRIEGISGRLGRFTPANTNALMNIPWSEDELEKIMLQRSELSEIPIIPASYSVTRNIMNAFREVVNNGSNPYSTMIIYNNDINDEIKRKKLE